MSETWGESVEPLYTAAQMHAYAQAALAAARGQEGELISAASEAEELLRGIEGMSRNNIEQMAVEVGARLRAAIDAAMKEKDHAR